jgi:hypothetical protein
MQVRSAGLVALVSVRIDRSMNLIITSQSSVYLPFLAQQTKIFDSIPSTRPHHRRQTISVANADVCSPLNEQLLKISTIMQYTSRKRKQSQFFLFLQNDVIIKEQQPQASRL